MKALRYFITGIILSIKQLAAIVISRQKSPQRFIQTINFRRQIGTCGNLDEKRAFCLAFIEFAGFFHNNKIIEFRYDGFTLQRSIFLNHASPFRFADITVQSLLRSFNFTSFTRVAFTVDAHCICTSLVFCVSNVILLSCIFQIINSQCFVNGEMYTYPSKKDLLGFRNTLAMPLLV